MIPMPPTRSDTAATAASSSESVLAEADAVLAISASCGSRNRPPILRQAMTLAQQRGDALDAGLDVVLGGELHEDRRDGTVLGVVAADDLASAGVERHEDHVVLVLAEGRLALRRHDADDLERHVADADGLVEGISVAEQAARHGAPEDDDDLAAADLFRIEGPRPSPRPTRGHRTSP